MDKTGIYSKTPQGQEEVGTRALKLPPKLRQLLIMIDGTTDVASLAERFEQDNAIGHLMALEHMGLISMAGAGANDSGVAQEDVSELRIDLSHLVLDSLGPDASDLAMQIEVTAARNCAVSARPAARSSRAAGQGPGRSLPGEG